MKETIFGTPLFSFRIDEPIMNVKLKQLLINMKANNETLKRGDHKNWHSDWLHDKKEPCLQKLTEITNAFFNKVVTSYDKEVSCRWNKNSWGVIDEKNESHLIHSHPHSDWSSVYYVDEGNENSGGELLLIDPRGSLVESARTKPDCTKFYTKMFGSCSVSIKPQTGLLLFFPSWLMHTVLTYKGEKPRISISTNFSLSEVK